MRFLLIYQKMKWDYKIITMKKKNFGDFGWNHKMNYFMNTKD